MHVAAPQLTIGPERAVLRTEVTVGDEVRPWWISAPAGLAGWIDVSAAPFLPTAVMVAAALGEDLAVDGAVPGAQLDGASTAVATFSGWWGWRLPTITAGRIDAPRHAGRRDGLLFSRGIDSMATLVDRIERGAAADTLLVTVADMEPIDSADVAARITDATVDAARAVDLPIAVLTTNLRDESDRAAPWDWLHPMAYLGCGLLLGPALRSLTLASGVAAGDSTSFGTRADIDPLWSTDVTEVSSGLAGVSRAEKAAIIARRPDLLVRVKLCWQSGVVGNCGRCSKCQHSMAAFAAAGAEDLLPQLFDHPLTAAGVRRRTRYSTPPVEEIAAALPEGSDLRDSLEEVVDRWVGGDRPGLTGVSVRNRPTGPLPDPTADGDRDVTAVGWGAGARPIGARPEDAHRLCRSRPAPDRPLPWAQVDRLGPGASRTALHLGECWPGGVVLLVDPERSDMPRTEPMPAPGAPRSAVRALLDAAAVRLWWSDDDHLDGIALLEAVEHGCVPVQLMDPDGAERLRARLPRAARVLVRTVVDLDGPLTDADLEALWTAAVGLVTTAVGAAGGQQ